jgi:glycosyltransferase involved in cell wall biosynthesis
VEGVQDNTRKVALCTPTLAGPLPAYVEAVKDAIPVLKAAGIEPNVIIEAGNPYISAARATMLRKALDEGADEVVFIDHDISFPPEALLTLIRTPCDVVAGVYRFKKDDEEYMGRWSMAPAVARSARTSARDDTLVLTSRAHPRRLPEDHPSRHRALHAGLSAPLLRIADQPVRRPLQPRRLRRRLVGRGLRLLPQLAGVRRRPLRDPGPQPDAPQRGHGVPRKPSRAPDAPARRRARPWPVH